MVRSQDVLLSVKLFLHGEQTYAKLSSALGLSVGEIHNAYDRIRQAEILTTVRGEDTISRKNLYRLLAHGIPSIFFAVRGPILYGLPTAYSHPALQSLFEDTGESLSFPVVWQTPQSSKKTFSPQDVRGESISPLYPSVTEASKLDSEFWEIMALVDVLRIGKTPSKNIALKLLEKRILEKKE
jgi:hypothetical protein